MSKNKIKFWLEDFKDIFKDIKVLPQNRDSLEERFNSLTRLSILISIVMMLFCGIKFGVLFLLMSMLTISAVYYGRTNVTCAEIKENFVFNNNNVYDKMNRTSLSPLLDTVSVGGYETVKLNTPPNLTDAIAQVTYPVKHPERSNLFCTSGVDLNNNQSQYSLNAKAFNGTTYMSPNNCIPNTNQNTNRYMDTKNANPNTRKAPVIVPPIWDLTSWRDNDFVNYSRINDQRIMDKYQSGYYVTNCPCNNPNIKDHSRCFAMEEKPYKITDLKEHYETTDLNFSKDNISPIQYGQPIARPYPYVEGIDIIEDPEYQQPGDVLTVAGYNPTNLKHNLPVNAAFGRCEKSNVFNEYNKDLYTQTIQPGYYNRSQVNDPISSNIGISWDQQFQPTTLEKEGNDLVYIEHDSRLFKPKTRSVYRNNVDMDNVYDPRYTGYGTSYRSYVDRLTGQPRHYYDDVNAIRRPNYLTRNKLDTFDFGETYGAMKENGEIIGNNCNINAKAQEKFLDDALDFRTSLQQSLMRKRNNEMWQLRKFPLSRAGQKQMGGGGGGARGANGGTNC